MSRKNDWLDVQLLRFHGELKFCISEKQYEDALHEILEKPLYADTWLKGDTCDAVVHEYKNSKDNVVFIVCLRPDDTRIGIETAGLLVHEAVHIHQRQMELYGEKSPGAEAEAYGIQLISQVLMTQYVELSK